MKDHPKVLNSISRYPWESNLKTPLTIPTFEVKLNKFYMQLNNILRGVKYQSKFKNLSSDERDTLNTLKRKKMLIYLMIKREGWFLHPWWMQLHKSRFWTSVRYQLVSALELSKKRSIKSGQTLNSQLNTLPYFYHLINTHKRSAGLKIICMTNYLNHIAMEQPRG